MLRSICRVCSQKLISSPLLHDYSYMTRCQFRLYSDRLRSSYINCFYLGVHLNFLFAGMSNSLQKLSIALLASFKASTGIAMPPVAISGAIFCLEGFFGERRRRKRSTYLNLKVSGFATNINSLFTHFTFHLSKRGLMISRAGKLASRAGGE